MVNVHLASIKSLIDGVLERPHLDRLDQLLSNVCLAVDNGKNSYITEGKKINIELEN